MKVCVESAIPDSRHTVSSFDANFVDLSLFKRAILKNFSYVSSFVWARIKKMQLAMRHNSIIAVSATKVLNII